MVFPLTLTFFFICRCSRLPTAVLSCMVGIVGIVGIEQPSFCHPTKICGVVSNQQQPGHLHVLHVCCCLASFEECAQHAALLGGWKCFNLLQAAEEFVSACRAQMGQRLEAQHAMWVCGWGLARHRWWGVGVEPWICMLLASRHDLIRVCVGPSLSLLFVQCCSSLKKLYASGHVARFRGAGVVL
jgi:hypothetical protein